MSILDDFKRPFNIVILAIALVSAGLAVYFWLDARRTSEISFRTETVKVFDSKAATPITVLNKDRQVITDDIFAISFFIFNSGDIDLDKSKIRVPITFNLNGPGKILEASISDINAAGNPGFTVMQNKSDEALLSWDFFDPGASVRVKLLYTGDDSTFVAASGSLLGIKNLTDVTKPFGQRHPWFGYVSSLLGLLMGGALGTLTGRAARARRLRKKQESISRNSSERLNVE